MDPALKSAAGPRPALFLAASVPDGKEYPGCERHRESARPQWIRDAVLALARRAFDAGIDLLCGAHPSISPMLLTVAREYPILTEPRITVYQSAFFLGSFPQETLELTDPSLGLGRLVQIPTIGDREGSLRQMREVMFRQPGLCAAVFVGGMDGLFDEAHRFQLENPGLPMYSVASAGGAALDLLDHAVSPYPPSYQPILRYTPDQFCGGAAAPIDPSVLRATGVGYTRVAREIVERLEAALRAGSLQPRV